MRPALCLTFALVLGAAACEAPEQHAPPPAAPLTTLSSSVTAPPATASAPGTPVTAGPLGLARLLPAIAAAQPKVKTERAALTPKLLSKQDPMRLASSGGRLYGVLLGERDDPSFTALLREDGNIEPLGPAPRPAALLPAPGGIIAASESGLSFHRPGAPAKMLHTGRVKTASSDGTTLVFAECASETAGCTVATLPAAGGTPKRAPGLFPIVHSVALWQGKLYVAGRFRDPREGVPTNPAEIAEQARWLTQGGPLPASARFAPGFIAVVDPAGGEPLYWPFPEHRPVDLIADGADLWLLTEGTPGRVFNDAVLARITSAGDWSVVATALSMPDQLKRSEHHLCWNEMPAQKFTVRCLDRRSGVVETLVEQDWNVLDFLLEGDTLTWSTLTKGLQRAKLP